MNARPCRPQDGSQGAPRGLRTAPGAFQEASRQPQERSKRLQDGSKSLPGGPSTAPRAFQEASRRLQESFMSNQEASRRLGEGPGATQTAPRPLLETNITFSAAVDLEKCSSADFSLHAGSTPSLLGRVCPSACRTLVLDPLLGPSPDMPTRPGVL